MQECHTAACGAVAAAPWSVQSQLQDQGQIILLQLMICDHIVLLREVSDDFLVYLRLCKLD